MKICTRCRRLYEDELLAFCLDDGAPLRATNERPRRKTWAWVLGFVAVLVLFGGIVVVGVAAWYFLYFAPKTSVSITDRQTPRATPSKGSSPISDEDETVSRKGQYDVTMQKYDRLTTGMPRAKVEEILGGKGEEISSSSGGGVTFTVNQWEGADYKSVIITFKNDKLTDKAQVGLK